VVLLRRRRGGKYIWERFLRTSLQAITWWAFSPGPQALQKKFEIYWDRIFAGFFGWKFLVLKDFNEGVGLGFQGLIFKMKKYGVFGKLFFVDGQGVKVDLAICTKRFVRRIHRRMIKEEAMEDDGV
jgi:hypothetical protein